MKGDIPKWLIIVFVFVLLGIISFMVRQEVSCYDECMKDYCGGPVHNIACDSISFQEDKNMTIAEEECHKFCVGNESIFDYI